MSAPRPWLEVGADPDGGIAWRTGPEITRADPRVYMTDRQLRHWVMKWLYGEGRPDEVRFDLMAPRGGHSAFPRPGDRLRITGDRTVIYRLVEYVETRSLDVPPTAGWFMEWPD